MSVNQLPRELRVGVLLYLEYSVLRDLDIDLIDAHFWELKATALKVGPQKFRRGLEKGKPKKLKMKLKGPRSPAEWLYLYCLTTRSRECSYGSECFLTLELCCERAAYAGDKLLLEYFLNRCSKERKWGISSNEYEHACQWACKGAARAHNFELLNDLPKDVKSVRSIVEGLAEGGDCELLWEYLQKYSKDTVAKAKARMLVSVALRCSIKGGHIDLTKRILDSYSIANYNLAVDDAARKGYTELVEIMLQKDPDSNYFALMGALAGAKVELVQRLLPGVILTESHYGGVGRGGSIECLRLLPPAVGENLKALISKASIYSKLGLLDYLISQGVDINYLLEIAASRHNTKSVKYLVSRGATTLNAALLVAAGENNVKMLHTLISLGAANIAEALEHAKTLGKVRAQNYLKAQLKS